MRIDVRIQGRRPILFDPETGREVEGVSRVRLDWVDGEGAEVTATWTNPDPADDAPARALDRSDFLPFPAEPEPAPSAPDPADDDRPRPRRALS